MKRREFIIGAGAALIVATGCNPPIPTEPTSDTNTDESNLVDGNPAVAHPIWYFHGDFIYRVDPNKNTIIKRLVDQGIWTVRNHPLNHPYGLIFTDEKLFVVHNMRRSLAIYDLDTGVLLSDLKSVNSGFSIFDGISADGDTFFATDPYHNRVIQLNGEGWIIQEFGSFGLYGQGQLNFPSGIASDQDGNLHVCDMGNRRIEVFSQTGTWVRRYGENLSTPRAIAIGNDGTSYIADSSASCIHLYDAAGLLFDVKYVSDRNGRTGPTHLSWTPDGDLYVRVV